jgi:hypothetical protein
MTNLLKALASCNFKPVIKDGTNPHFKSRYASLEAVIAATDDELRRNNLAIVQTYDGEGLRTTLYHVSGESISGVQPLLMVKRDAQGFASASTYARRYGILAMLNLAAEDDDGNDAVNDEPRKRLIADAVRLYDAIEHPSEKLTAWIAQVDAHDAAELTKGISAMKKMVKV